MPKPPMKWDADDWLNDEKLTLCTSATRGVWSDLVSQMHRSGQTGQLSGTCDQLAKFARCSAAEMAHALTDLKTTGAADVNERNGIVTVMNRRMSREHKKRQLANERQLRRRQKGASRDRHGDVIEPPELHERDGAISIRTLFVDQDSDPRRESKKEKSTARAKFKPPTVEEVRAFCVEKKYDVDAEYFVAFYEANGWVQGKQGKPIRSWQHCVVTWTKNPKFGASAAGGRRTVDPTSFPE